jgi:hypothetical protein
MGGAREEVRVLRLRHLPREPVHAAEAGMLGIAAAAAHPCCHARLSVA